MHTLRAVEFEWDERKAAENLRKHGVDFADAALVLEEDLALTVEDPDAQGEERWGTIRTSGFWSSPTHGEGSASV